MKQKRLFLLLLLLTLLCAYLVACSPGHLGSNEVAFVRDGHLWTIDPDGANAFEVVSGSTPLIGYAWSPDHQIFAFRQLDSHFASTPAGKHLQVNPITGLSGDLPASLNTVSIDGGMPIPIIDSSSGIQFSNTWWNSNGQRLLYREESTTTQEQLAIKVSWWVSQNDQPNGIARKALPPSFSIPSFNQNSSLAIGNSSKGIFSTTLAGADFHLLADGTLPGHPLPAALERVLWQPAHSNPLLLYAVTDSPTPTPTASISLPATSPPSTSTAAQSVTSFKLVLNNGTGLLSDVTTCNCTQFSWSPDGNSILYSTGTTYSVYNVNTHATYSFSGEDGSAPYWSPDSRFILLDGLHTLSLINVASQSWQLLLSDGFNGFTGENQAAVPGPNALVQPLSNSLWAADSRHFLILTRARLFWQGQRLDSGNGLYTVSIDDQGRVQQGSPSLVDRGIDTQAGWSYEDPNTSFLFP